MNKKPERQKFSRKELKKAARENLKRHYFLFIAICFVLAAFNIDYEGTLDFLSVKNSIYAEALKDGKEDGEGTGALEGDGGVYDILGMIISGNLDEARFQEAVNEEVSKEKKSEEEEKIAEQNEARKNGEKASGLPILGTTHGELAKFVNAWGNGSILVGIADKLYSLTDSAAGTAIIFAIAAVIVFIFIEICIKSVVGVISNRFFLEGRTYEEVPASRVLYPLQFRKWMHMAWVLLVKDVYLLLWSLTIAGFFIKINSYRMVPYIIAENPTLSANEAITLSRKMMDGYKFQAFVLDLSLIGWMLLGPITLGLSSLFYSNAYKASIEAELYAWLRGRGQADGVENIDVLGDVYLYEKAPEAAFSPVYDEVKERISHPREALQLTGARAFMSKWFGIVLRYDDNERAYERDQAERNALETRETELEGKAYPLWLNPYMPERSKKSVKHFSYGYVIYYVRNYSIVSLLLIFFLTSAVGKGWEVIYHFINNGTWVNRGYGHGPWLPIYGSGAVLMLIVLHRLRKHPVLHFFGTIVLCGAVEYFTGWACETFLGRRLWSYDGYLLNLHGRICAEGLLAFGVGGIAIVYLVAPMFDDLIRMIPRWVSTTIAAVLLVCFIGDMIYSKYVPNTNTGEGSSSSQTASDASTGTADTSSGGSSEASAAAAAIALPAGYALRQ